jgi:predicted NBD/HSP70 family sugar kinase
MNYELTRSRPEMKKATRQHTKHHNRNLVLRTMFAHDSVSRAEIARVTHLTRTTVSEIVSGLLEEGLVEEVGIGESIGGKSPILLSVAADSRYLIGLNLARDKFIGAIVNLRGEISETVEAPVLDNNGGKALDLVFNLIDQLLRKRIKPIVGIGIGTPGLVNTRDGIVINAVNLDWRDLPLGQMLEKKYKLPVSVLNDSQATAIGEFVYGGQHTTDENLIVINMKHGIGSGILINGRLFQGDGGGAGEIGHVVFQGNNELCSCGKRGCLETISSARAVLKKLSFKSLDQAREAYEAGNKNAIKVVNSAALHLGMVLGNLIGTLNIHRIVLTGDMTQFGPAWLNAVSDAMRNSVLARMSENTRLELGTLDYRACILGASAYLLLDDYSLLFTLEK